MANYTYKSFTDNAKNISARELVSAPLWSGNSFGLYSVYTSSEQSNTQKRYFYEVYNTQSYIQGSESQFSLTYGDYPGSGSSTGSYNVSDYDYPTRAIYSQYKRLLLNSGVDLFEFPYNDGTIQTSEHIYVVNVNRSRFKDRMDTNTWQLSLSKLTGKGSASIASNADIITLIDDSGTSTTALAQQGGRVYSVRSGSLKDGLYTGTYANTPWGLFYPDNGVIVLNGKALDASASYYTSRSYVPTVSQNTYTGSMWGDNSAYRFFNSVSGAIAYSPTTHSFQGRTSEVVSSAYYFVRIYSNEYNYTTNSSFLDSNYKIKFQRMREDPKVYITTIGLYDDSGNLLAIAKLSKPIQKSFDREVIIKVKLDY